MEKKVLTGMSFFISLLLVAVAALAPSISSASYQAHADEPSSLLYDGTSIWVANQNSNTVTKLLARSGMTLGTYKVGDNPVAVVASDGAVWVVNQFGHSVTKLQASTGATVGTYGVGDAPTNAIIEGGNLWVTNFDSRSAAKLRTSDGAKLSSFGKERRN
jgi:streptogramin lyase